MRKRVFKSICIICLFAVLFAGIPAGTVHGYSTGYPNNWENTGDQARDIAKIAESQVGYTESGYNHTKYNAWMFGSDASQPWCTSFVAWCANQAGISTSVIPKVARAASMRSGISNFYSPGQGTPKIGDIVFFSSYANGSIGHSGIVTGYSNGTITLVHGNWGGNVCYGTVQWKSGARISNSQYIVGIGRPNYPPDPKKYTVSFDANGGIGAPAPQTKVQWKTLKLNTIVPARPFYEFLGWAESADAQEAVIQPGSAYTADSAVRYYAVWRRLPVSVTYEDSGTQIRTVVFGSDEIPVTEKEEPEKDGCRFLGWRDEISGKIYQTSETIEISSDMICLEALWEGEILYRADNGMRGVSVQTHLCGAEERISAECPRKEDAVFCGWSDEEGMLFHPFETIPGDWTRKTLTAQWTQAEGTRTVVFYAAEADDPQQPLQMPAGEDGCCEIVSWVPEKEGCVFTGWKDAEGTLYTSGDWITVGDSPILLTAVWETTVTFDPQNASDSPFSQTYPISQPATIPQEVPEKEGAVFCGWMSQTGRIYHPGDLMSAELDGTTLNAQWREATQYRFGWNQIGNNWYYIGTDGAMCSGWKKIDGKWFHFDDLGAMQTGWLRLNGYWYLCNGSGIMQTGWVKSGGKWYYLSSSGEMKTGWVFVSGKWYYLNRSGAMQTYWFKVGDKWYYADASGAMQTNRWIGNYYVQSDGSMASNRWIGKYHVNNDGRWDRTK